MSGGSFKIEFKDRIWHLSGVIDEFADLDELSKAPMPLRLNLSGITRMNSIGIRNFLGFLRSWGEKPLAYEECPVEFVDQMNLIPALRGIPRSVAEVESMFVPFSCSICQQDHEILIKTKKIIKPDKSIDPPARLCPSCQAPMTVEPDHYFSFLSAT